MNYADKIFKLIDAEPGKNYTVRLKSGAELKDRVFCICSDLTVYEIEGDKFMPVPLGLSCILNGTWELTEYQKPLTPEEEQIVIKYARLCGYNWLLKDTYGKRSYAFGLKEKPKQDKNGKYFVEDVGYFLPISLPFLKEDEPYYIGDGGKE